MLAVAIFWLINLFQSFELIGDLQLESDQFACTLTLHNNVTTVNCAVPYQHFLFPARLAMLVLVFIVALIAFWDTFRPLFWVLEALRDRLLLRLGVRLEGSIGKL